MEVSWKAQSYQTAFLQAVRPEVRPSGAATKAASLNSGCWLWTYSSFLFMEILLQTKNVSVVPKEKSDCAEP